LIAEQQACEPRTLERTPGKGGHADRCADLDVEEVRERAARCPLEHDSQEIDRRRTIGPLLSGRGDEGFAEHGFDRVVGPDRLIVGLETGGHAQEMLDPDRPLGRLGGTPSGRQEGVDRLGELELAAEAHVAGEVEQAQGGEAGQRLRDRGQVEGALRSPLARHPASADHEEARVGDEGAAVEIGLEETVPVDPGEAADLGLLTGRGLDVGADERPPAPGTLGRREIDVATLGAGQAREG
jgi:hypothetical protein